MTGKFAFTHVLDGTSEVSLQVITRLPDGRNSYEESQGVPLDLRPGQKKTDVRIGGMGRPLIAHVIVGDALRTKGLMPSSANLILASPPGFIPPPNWDTMTKEQKVQLRLEYEQTEAYKAFAAKVKQFVALVKPDGTVRFEDVPAGQYTLHVSVQRDDPDDASRLRADAAGQQEVTVDEIPGGRSDDPMDIGSIVLGEMHPPELGQMFPDFQPATLDDKKFSFADLRGKYVLIDFWATWCGPCIAEMKHIQRLHDQYANDPRLVIVGISVDDRADEPTQFLRTRKLPWRQAFAGASVWNTLSLRAIPSVWLIGPDGRILARQIPEEQLDQTIEKALGHGK